jgi:hypothetical protein
MGVHYRTTVPVRRIYARTLPILRPKMGLFTDPFSTPKNTPYLLPYTEANTLPVHLVRKIRSIGMVTVISVNIKIETTPLKIALGIKLITLKTVFMLLLFLIMG